MYEAVIRPGDRCFDVGANAGGVARYFAYLAGERGSVVAFEPVWPTYQRLCQALRAAPPMSAPITAVPFGLSDAPGWSTVHVPAGEFGMASLAPAEAWRVKTGRHLVEYRCQFDTLDGFLASTGEPPPDVLKIDVEGAELLVLRGASGLFAADHRPLLLIELFAPWQEALGFGPWDILCVLSDLSYKVVFQCPEGLVEHHPTAVEPFPTGYVAGANVIAYVPGIHDRRLSRLTRLLVNGGGRVLPIPTLPMPNRPTARFGGAS